MRERIGALRFGLNVLARPPPLGKEGLNKASTSRAGSVASSRPRIFVKATWATKLPLDASRAPPAFWYRKY